MRWSWGWAATVSAGTSAHIVMKLKGMQVSSFMQKNQDSSFFVAFILSLLNRNPDTDEGPWCYTYKNMQLTWELCNIPKCGELPHDHTVIFK